MIWVGEQMNAFEDIVALYLEEEGYWVRQSVKVVRITKSDKRALKKHSMPTPEIDIVALNMKRNELLLVEVKSFLDSQGVDFDSLTGKYKSRSEKYESLANRYRLFNNKKYREIVTERLREEYLEKGLIKKNTEINYGLAAGKIYTGEESDIRDYFIEMGWRLFLPEQIKDKISELSNKVWEDNLVTMTAKLVLRVKK